MSILTVTAFREKNTFSAKEFPRKALDKIHKTRRSWIIGLEATADRIFLSLKLAKVVHIP